MKRAGKTEHEIKQQREGNKYTADELKLKLILNMLDSHEFIEKITSCGIVSNPPELPAISRILLIFFCSPPSLPTTTINSLLLAVFLRPLINITGLISVLTA
jgi:hypothetical protein